MDVKRESVQHDTLAMEAAARGFSACGSEPRLLVLRLLVRAGDEGLTVGQIQLRSGLPASTLAHHLAFLAAGGLVKQERRGRTVISRADYMNIRGLAEFLLEECCFDTRTSARPDTSPVQSAARGNESP